MYPVYHCGKNPELICAAASLGAIDVPCGECEYNNSSKCTEQTGDGGELIDLQRIMKSK